jgi:hypothetical protein
MDYNTTRIVHCEVCGKPFKDDCGDVFCSNRCERRYDDDHACCEECGNECGKDNLNSDNICENCEEEE